MIKQRALFSILRGTSNNLPTPGKVVNLPMTHVRSIWVCAPGNRGDTKGMNEILRKIVQVQNYS